MTEGFKMTHAEKKLAVKTAEQKPAKDVKTTEPWRPLESLRRQVDRLFDDFNLNPLPFRLGSSLLDSDPFLRRGLLGSNLIGSNLPVADIVDKAQSIDINIELPGLDEKDIEIKLTNGNLAIRGEKKEEREENEQDYYLCERRYGAFARYFSLPEGVDAEHVEARMNKGVLTISLPKKPEAISAEKRIEIKTS